MEGHAARSVVARFVSLLVAYSLPRLPLRDRGSVARRHARQRRSSALPESRF